MTKALRATAPSNPRRLGLLLALGPILAALLAGFETSSGAIPLTLSPGLQGSLLLLYFVSLLARIRTNKRLGQAGFLVVLSSYGLFYLNSALEHPSAAFVYFCLLAFAVLASVRLKQSEQGSPRTFADQLLLHASLALLPLWSYLFLFQHTQSRLTHTFSFAGATIVGLLLLYRTLFLNPLVRLRFWLIGGSFVLGLSMIVRHSVGWSLETFSQATLVLIIVALLVIMPTRQLRERLNAWIESIFFHPEGSILVTFLALGSLGTFLLMLPISTRSGESLSLIDAAFTSISAVCVTGLVVKDTALDFSGTGQFFLLILIQMGGLGIMFLSAIALLFIGQRVSLRQESALLSVMGQRLKGEMRAVLRRVLILTFCLEGTGALLLTLAFRRYEENWGQALWQGIFTAISAFCNAGFAIQSQNLLPFREDHFLVHVVAALIILGGLSPGFILAMPRFQKLILRSVQLRMILFGTSSLLVLGTLFFLGIEWDRSLAELSPIQKWTNAWFQSVTTRTAGFNTIEMGLLAPASQLLMMGLMFIGGSPGGTAGGIKTTTLMVLIFAARAVARGEKEVHAFRRKLPTEVVLRAMTVSLLALSVALVSFLALLLTQDLAPFSLLFEVFSALGTVGLSIGITPELNAVGKFLIMCCMYIGRVGPLTLALYLAQSSQVQGSKWPEEAVNVG